MKILVCDDDPVALKVIQLALSDIQAEILVAKDGYRALDFLRQHPNVSLIITDIHMPYHNGDAILHHVRQEQNKKTPIIMVSSDTDQEVVALAMKSGVNEFVKKPLDPDQLRKAIKRFIP